MHVLNPYVLEQREWHYWQWLWCMVWSLGGLTKDSSWRFLMGDSMDRIRDYRTAKVEEKVKEIKVKTEMAWTKNVDKGKPGKNVTWMEYRGAWQLLEKYYRKTTARRRQMIGCNRLSQKQIWLKILTWFRRKQVQFTSNKDGAQLGGVLRMRNLFHPFAVSVLLLIIKIRAKDFYVTDITHIIVSSIFTRFFSVCRINFLPRKVPCTVILAEIENKRASVRWVGES